MLNTFRETIDKAVQAAGYKALIISMKEHNDDITDHIIAEIRRSKFVIADFTGLRGGVYYEAGFAAGLGKPVIFTCRKDWFNETKYKEIEAETSAGKETVKIPEERRIHFDISHMNFIVWENEKELYEKLSNRIRATII